MVADAVAVAILAIAGMRPSQYVLQLLRREILCVRIFKMSLLQLDVACCGPNTITLQSIYTNGGHFAILGPQY